MSNRNSVTPDHRSAPGPAAHPLPPHRRSGGLRAAATTGLLLFLHGALLAAAQMTLEVTVLVDGETVAVTPLGEAAPVERQGDRFLLREGTSRLDLAFPGGSASIAAADVGVWDLAHVLAVRVVRQGEDRYGFDTTVRHRDEGWDHYADVWRVVGDGVENGERILLHPHDDEQPFTRSQSNVTARGIVTVEAGDSIHGLGGTVVMLDLDALTTDERTVELRLTRLP